MRVGWVRAGVVGAVLTGGLFGVASPAAASYAGVSTSTLGGGLLRIVLTGGDGVEWISCANAGGTDTITVNFAGDPPAQFAAGAAGCGGFVEVEIEEDLGHDFDNQVFVGGEFLLDDFPGLQRVTANLGEGVDWYGGTDTADHVSGGDGADSLSGGAGDDQLLSGAGADSLSGGPGDDLLRGGDDGDTLDGGADDDSVYGDSGDDLLDGGGGDDRVQGGAGSDTVAGGDGHDTIWADTAAVGSVDVATGGPGDDTFRNPNASSHQDPVVDLGTGTDTWSQGLFRWDWYLSRSGDTTTFRWCDGCGSEAAAANSQAVLSAEVVEVNGFSGTSSLTTPLFTDPPVLRTKVYAPSASDLVTVHVAVPAGVVLTASSQPPNTVWTAPGFEDLVLGQYAELAQTQAEPPSAPSKPLVTGAGATSVSLTWTAPSSTGGSPVTGYVVERFHAGSAGPVASTPVAGTSATVPAPADRAVRYAVRAVNGAGPGPRSTASAYAVAPFTGLDAFTTRQHQDLLGRSPSSTELAEWRSVLAAGTALPSARIAGLSDSAYWSGAIDPVVRLYRAYFLRLPDRSGLGYWAGRRRAGMLLSSISSTFAASSEFQNRYGSLTNRQFVELVYQNVLDRAGEPGGVTYWTGQLDSGRSTRGRVMIGFSESSEHKNKRAGDVNTVNVYFGMLRRTPTVAEVDAWRASAATSKADLIASLLASAAYDART